MRRLLIVILIALAAPASADAATVAAAEDGTPDRPYQAWIDSAKIPTPSVTVTITERSPMSCGEPACAYPGAPANPTAYYIEGEPKHLTRGVFLHELGHVADFAALDDSERQRWIEISGVYERPWWSGPNASAEKFAESYQLCATGRTPMLARHVQGGYNYRVTPQQHRQICRFLLSAI